MKIGDIIDTNELISMVEPEVYKIAMEIYQDIERYSFKVLEDFYRDYQPMEYRRLGQMPRVWEKPTVKKTKTGYEIIFSYSMDGLSLRHKDPHDYWIFNGPFEQGYHGGPRMIVDSYEKRTGRTGRSYYVAAEYHYEPAPRMLPSPWEQIFRYAEVKYDAVMIENEY